MHPLQGIPPPSPKRNNRWTPQPSALPIGPTASWLEHINYKTPKYSLNKGLRRFLSTNSLPHLTPILPQGSFLSCFINYTGCLNLSNSTSLSFSCFIPSSIQPALIIPSPNLRMGHNKEAGHPIPWNGH